MVVYSTHQNSPLKTNDMEAFYILNTKTDKSFDPIENKFYPASWEPVLSEKAELQAIMDNDPERFEDRIIIEI